MTNKQWRAAFNEAIEDITGKNPTGLAVTDLWNMAEKADPLQENTNLRTAMYLLFAYEKTPALHNKDSQFFPKALDELFPEGA